MYIQDLQIDGFGLYQNVRVENIPAGLSLFYGVNEAGKSTCLEFLRTMLTGFPQGKGAKRFVPRETLLFGGSVTLVLDSGEVLHLSRSKTKQGNELTLHTFDGSMLPPTRINELLAGVSRNVYTRVFGFSLDELAQHLAPEDVQDALYSATFGAGLKDPKSAIKALTDTMAKKYTVRGKTSELNRSLEGYHRLCATITTLSEENSQYDHLALQQATLKNALTTITSEKQQLEQEERILERRLDAWQQWDEWQALGIKLEQLPILSPHFPEHGTATLEQLEREIRKQASAFARQDEKCRRLEESYATIPLDPRLLAELPLLLRLSENKAHYREALLRLPAQQANVTRIEKELYDTLLRLGPSWSCERIRQTDLSLFSHNTLEATAIDLRAASSAHEASVAALEQLNNDVTAAEQASENAKAELNALAEPDCLLSEAERDDLRRTIARIEEGERQIPEKELICQNTQASFQRAWESLQMPKQAADNPVAKLDAILEEQHTVRALAQTVQDRILQQADAERSLEQIETRIHDLTQRKEALTEAHQGEAPDRESLEEQARAIRRLRTQLQSFERNGEDVRTLEQELAQEPLPTSDKNIPLMVVGAILLLLGLGMLSAHIFLKIATLPLTETLSIPINLWSGYLVLFAGVLGLWGGAPHDSKDLQHRVLERKRKEERLETLRKKVAAQEEEIQALAALARTTELDEVTLDAVEVRITRDREHCILSEQYQTGLQSLTQEMNFCLDHRDKLLKEMEDKNARVQQARLAWHESLQSFGLTTIPDAAQATTFLTRIEMTRMSYETVAQAERSLENLEQELTNLTEKIAQIPPIKEMLATLAPQESFKRDVVLGQAKELLSKLLDADRMREKRASAQARLSACADEENRLKKRREEASLTLEKTAKRLETVSAQWSKCLKDLGLSQSLNPQTASQALQCMQDCLSIESTLQTARDVLEQTKRQLALLSEPLAEMLERLGEVHEKSASVDWLAVLDTKLARAQAVERMKRDKEALAKRIQEETTERDLCAVELEHAKEELAAFLAQAECKDREEFLAKDRAFGERLAAQERRASLTTNLEILAGKEGLEAFLAEFAKEDRATQEARQDTLKARLQALAEEERAKMRELAAIEARVQTLSSSEELSKSLQEKSSLTASMQESALEWAKYALAVAILEKTRRQFEEERQPQVLRTASQIFQRITHGQWKSIVISLDQNKTLRMLAEGSTTLVAPEMLSRGTQEQAYLALRLAYILSHAQGAETLPLLMDEVLVNFDRDRAARTIQELARMSHGAGGKIHQIFYFTCHQETVDLFKQEAPNAALFLVENGQISRA